MRRLLLQGVALCASTALSAQQVLVPTPITPARQIFFTPLDYGARCDAATSVTPTDDTTALKAMFTAISATSGGIVIDFPGMCAFSLPLTVPPKANVTIDGHGTGGLVYIGAATVLPGGIFSGYIAGSTLTLTSTTTAPVLGDMVEGAGIPVNTFIGKILSAGVYQLATSVSWSGGVPTTLSVGSSGSPVAMTSVPPAILIGAVNNGLHGYTIKDIHFRSKTAMTDGWGVEINNVQPLLFSNVDMGLGGSTAVSSGGGDRNWFNGILFAGGSDEHVMGIYAGASNIAEALSGQLANPTIANLNFMQDGSSDVATAKIGILIGGTCGGCTFTSTDVYNNGANVRIDQSITNSPSRQIFFGKSFFIDATNSASYGGTGIGLDIADPGNSGLTTTFGWEGTWLSAAEKQCILIESNVVYWTMNFTGGHIATCGQAGTLATGGFDNESTSTHLQINLNGVQIFSMANSSQYIYNIATAGAIDLSGVYIDATNAKFTGSWFGSIFSSNGNQIFSNSYFVGNPQPLANNTYNLGGASFGWLDIYAAALISTGTKPTLTTGTCSASGGVGGTTAGTFIAPVCAAGTIILSGLPAAPNGWACTAYDLTTPADTLVPTAATTTSATLKATTVAADVVQFHCAGY